MRAFELDALYLARTLWLDMCYGCSVPQKMGRVILGCHKDHKVNAKNNINVNINHILPQDGKETSQTSPSKTPDVADEAVDSTAFFCFSPLKVKISHLTPNIFPQKTDVT